MLRKTATLSLLMLSLASSTWAQPPGFYVGAGLGPQAIDFKQMSYVKNPGDFYAKNVSNNSGTGVFGTLFGGYAWTRQAYYLAAEINANLSSAQFAGSNSEYVHGTKSSTTENMLYNFGISLLPGYSIFPTTLFYFRVGYTYGNFKVSTSDPSLSNVNRGLSGFTFGLGVDQMLTQNVSARMEYTQTDYNSTQFTATPSPITKQTKITPTSGLVAFSLIYSFV